MGKICAIITIVVVILLANVLVQNSGDLAGWIMWAALIPVAVIEALAFWEDKVTYSEKIQFWVRRSLWRRVLLITVLVLLAIHWSR